MGHKGNKNNWPPHCLSPAPPPHPRPNLSASIAGPEWGYGWQDLPHGSFSERLTQHNVELNSSQAQVNE